MGRTSFEITECFAWLKIGRLGNLVLRVLQGQRQGALQGSREVLSFVFLTKYRISNEYRLRAFLFPNRSVTTVCPHGVFLTALRVGWQAEGLPEATALGSEQSRELVELTALSTSSAVRCALGVLARCWTPPMGTEVSGSASGVRVGSGLLQRAHSCPSNTAGPEATDVTVTSDRRIFPFYIQASLPPALPARVLGWGWCAPADPSSQGFSLLIFWEGVLLALTPVHSQIQGLCRLGHRPLLLQGGSCCGPSGLLWILLWYLKAEGKRCAAVGWKNCSSESESLWECTLWWDSSLACAFGELLN